MTNTSSVRKNPRFHSRILAKGWGARTFVLCSKTICIHLQEHINFLTITFYALFKTTTIICYFTLCNQEWGIVKLTLMNRLSNVDYPHPSQSNNYYDIIIQVVTIIFHCLTIVLLYKGWAEDIPQHSPLPISTILPN